MTDNEKLIEEAAIEALEELANGATPGPWEAGDVWVYTMPVYPDDNRLSNVLGMKYADEDRADAEHDRGMANAAFIAAADPTMVIALIGEIRRARAALAVFEKAHEAYLDREDAEYGAVVEQLEAAEKAHTPTDDEREEIIGALLDELGWEWDDVPEEHIASSREILGDMADRVLAVSAGFRRSEVPKPSEQQAWRKS